MARFTGSVTQRTTKPATVMGTVPTLVWRGEQDSAASVDMPVSGIEDGDLIVVWFFIKPDTYPSTVAPDTLSPGFTLAGGPWEGGGYTATPTAGNGNTEVWVCTKTATAADNGASRVFTFSGAISSWFVIAEIWRYVDTVIPLSMGSVNSDPPSTSLSFSGGTAPATAAGDVLTWAYARTDDWALPNVSSVDVSGGGGTWSSASVNKEGTYTPGDDISGSLLSSVSDGGSGGVVSWTAEATTPDGLDDLRGVAGGLILKGLLVPNQLGSATARTTEPITVAAPNKLGSVIMRTTAPLAPPLPWTYWDGAAEQPVTITYWDGAAEQPLTHDQVFGV